MADTDNTTQYLGLTKKKAQDLAEAKNFVFRLIRIDDEQFFSYPADPGNYRVCCEIEKGVVIKATIW